MTIVEWYESVCRDESFNDIQTLMQKRGQLAASTVTLAKKIKDKQTEWRRSKFLADLQKKRRVIELQTTTDHNTGKVHTSAKSNDIADSEMADQLELVAIAEAELDGEKLILKQLNQVLEAMRQDIAEMRQFRNDDRQ